LVESSDTDAVVGAEAAGRADEVARRLLALMPRLQGWAAAAVQANRRPQDPSLRQIAVLYVIREGATSPGQVARRLRITPAVVTGLLDRLEQRGFVRRSADLADRRRLRVALTAAGLAASTATQRLLTDELAAQLATAPAADLAAAERGLDLLAAALAALEARTPTPAGAEGGDDGGAVDAPDGEADADGDDAVCASTWNDPDAATEPGGARDDRLPETG
jgi:DNA-binding MarR family transcriptional regulator